ncbi:unnamed protein product [Trichogramma brassicae]|uniref:DUF7041 domain-containing protein n=1 Tax=Trichogramma brassicae TaxID=86971 RepID=A0A6H5I1K3_9HYME|nr:unnamed protein product [Trichogramma brassicae]
MVLERDDNNQHRLAEQQRLLEQQQLIEQQQLAEQQRLTEQQRLNNQRPDHEGLLGAAAAGKAGAAVNIPLQVHRVAVRLSPFWPDKPAVWFAQAEAQFALAAEVEDIISNPPARLPYTNLRQSLINRLSVSEEQRVRQLISEEELGDRKPSQFLRHLRSLASTTIIHDNLLRQLWMQRLPSHVRAILASHPELALDKLADLADKISEVSPTPPNFTVNAMSAAKGAEDPLLRAISELKDTVVSIALRQRHRLLDDLPLRCPDLKPRTRNTGRATAQARRLWRYKQYWDLTFYNLPHSSARTTYCAATLDYHSATA